LSHVIIKYLPLTSALEYHSFTQSNSKLLSCNYDLSIQLYSDYPKKKVGNTFQVLQSLIFLEFNFFLHQVVNHDLSGQVTARTASLMRLKVAVALPH
jgi:hypothetical protein